MHTTLYTPATKANVIAFNATLARLHLMPDKKEIVKQLSQGRVVSSKELTDAEIKNYLANLPKYHKPIEKDPREKMIRHIVAMAREMGMVLRQHHIADGGNMVEKSHYQKLNVWMLERSYLKKKLNEYTYNEMPKLVSQVQAIYKSYLIKK